MTQGLLELGEIMLAASQRRLDIVSRNVANASTPGFKKDVMFEATLDASSRGGVANVAVTTDFEQGAMRVTGRGLDLAIAGPGFFQVRAGERHYYTRSGAFERDGGGRLVNAQGFALQSADGGDVIVGANATEILSDGVVLEAGLPVARIGVFEADDTAMMRGLGGTMFEAPAGTMRQGLAVNLRQGMLEAANVDMAGEMLDMMAAIRSAEVGARVVQAYDTLIGQSISTFGRGQR